MEVEKDLSDDPRRQVVLVSANSIQALKAAYPNYYVDTGVFLAFLNRVMTQDRKGYLKNLQPMPRGAPCVLFESSDVYSGHRLIAWATSLLAACQTVSLPNECNTPPDAAAGRLLHRGRYPEPL